VLVNEAQAASRTSSPLTHKSGYLLLVFMDPLHPSPRHYWNAAHTSYIFATMMVITNAQTEFPIGSSGSLPVVL